MGRVGSGRGVAGAVGIGLPSAFSSQCVTLRGVHLIPKFGEIGQATEIKNRIDRARSEWMLTSGTTELGKREKAWLDVFHEREWSPLAHYEDFWLNSWVDGHLYKTIW